MPKKRKKKKKKRKVAGGVVLKKSTKHKNRFMVALVKVRGKWRLPKGRMDDGEGKKETALREVFEETGLHCEVVKKLGKSEYKDRKIFFYLMRVTGGRIGKTDPGEGLTESKWFYTDEAVDVMARKNEKKMLVKGLDSVGKL